MIPNKNHEHCPRYTYLSQLHFIKKVCHLFFFSNISFELTIRKAYFIIIMITFTFAVLDQQRMYH